MRFGLFEGLADILGAFSGEEYKENRNPERVEIIEDLSEVIEIEEIIEDWTEGNPNPTPVTKEYLYAKFPFLR